MCIYIHTMKFLILKTTDPNRNLATEEYLFTHCDEDIFMLWQNEPTVVIGKNQNAFAELNMDYIKNNNIHIVRRITGGGAVYHDLGNVNYTFISTKKGSCGIDFEYFTKPIIEALASVGIFAELSGRNDILIDGKKVSGNAQHTNEKRVLHHGTLLFDSDLSVLSDALKVDEEKIKAKAIKSVRSRVTNIKEYLPELDVSDFISLIEKFLKEKYAPEILRAPTDDEISKILSKYTSNEWVFPNSDYISQYTVKKKCRYPFGSVEIQIKMKNDSIKKIKIHGDFFGVKDTSELEAYLENTSLNVLENKLSAIHIEDYILGMTSEDFIKQIK